MRCNQDLEYNLLFTGTQSLYLSVSVNKNRKASFRYNNIIFKNPSEGGSHPARGVPGADWSRAAHLH